MRRAQRATTVGTLAGALLLLAVTGCSDSTDPSGGSTVLSAAETSDIGAAEGDEVDQSVEAMEVDGTSRWQCATVDNTADTDGDRAPDHATFTFALPACSFSSFRGGGLEVTGTIALSDPTPTSLDFAFQATLTDLQFTFTSPNASLSYTALRNGTRVLTGNAGGASLSNTITVARTWPARPATTVSHNLLLSFTPASGESLALGQPLPNGTFTRSGTFIWSRAGASRTFTVTTVEPLVWDASCTTDRKIVSGETRATLSDGSYVRTVWSGCGSDPTRTFVPAA
ncbi:MAG: hypothetical protein ACJ8DJ_10050 [Gemmatimonadales bacterium]